MIGRERGNPDQKSRRGGEERFRYSLGDQTRVSGSKLADHGKSPNHPDDSSEKAEHRSEVGYHTKGAQVPRKNRRLMLPRTDHGALHFADPQVAPGEACPDDSRERHLESLAEAGRLLEIRPYQMIFESGHQFVRQDFFAAKRNQPLNNNRDGNDRAEPDGNHRVAALHEKLPHTGRKNRLCPGDRRRTHLAGHH